MSTAVRRQQRYDHRLRELGRRTGEVRLATDRGGPRSTARGTATPALAAIQETAKSAVPTLGYGVSYAVGNVLLAVWGTVIVALLR